MGCKDVARGIRAASSLSGLEQSLVPCQAWEAFLPQRQIRLGASCHSQKPLRCIQDVGGKELGRGSHPYQGWKVGLAHMLWEQPITGFEVRKAFFSPQGRFELVPRGLWGFLPFSAALSCRALFQGSSGSFWLSARLLVWHPKEPTGALMPLVELLLS